MEPQEPQKPETANTGGRPSIIGEAVVTKLIAAFQRGWTDEKACEYAEISTRTFYRHMQSDERFCQEVRLAKNFWLQLAGDNITGILQNKSNDPRVLNTRWQASKWIYENKMPQEYGPKPTIFAQQNNQNNNYISITDGQLTELIKSGAFNSVDPGKVVAVNPAGSMAGGEVQGTTVELHQDPIRSSNPQEQDLQGT